jgi:hypothetical protein
MFARNKQNIILTAAPSDAYYPLAGRAIQIYDVGRRPTSLTIMPSDIVFDGCAVIAFIALEPGGLLLFLSQKSNQKARKKNNLPMRFNRTLCLDPE